MQLAKALMNRLEIIAQEGQVTEPITGLAYHSAHVQPGNIFVCIKGYVTDGHAYLPQAKAKGAAVAVVETLQDVAIPQLLVKDSRLALAALADTYYDSPSEKLKVVGITATNGKTSTSFMLESILKEAKLKTGIIGTVMTRFDDQLIPSVLTTPESLDLHHYFSQMHERGVSHAVMEVSSSGLELGRVGFVDFDVVTFNNISHEHIDQHGSFEAYLNHKSSLIKGAKRDAWAILNLDDDHSAALVNQTKAHVLTYGISNTSGDLTIEGLDLSTGKGAFDVVINKPITFDHGQVPARSFHVSLGVAGYHSVVNAMAAIGAALALGISEDAIKNGLAAYAGVERRFEFIYEGDFVIIDDHFANAGNIDVTLKTMDHMTYDKLHLVYAIRGSRGVTVNRENAEAIIQWSTRLGLKELIATLSVGHVGQKDTVTQEEKEVFLSLMHEAGLVVHLYDTLNEAILEGLNRTNKGDVLLLAGCQGMDYGGQIALKHLSARHPEWDQEVLFAPLKDRVCGIE